MSRPMAGVLARRFQPVAEFARARGVPAAQAESQALRILSAVDEAGLISASGRPPSIALRAAVCSIARAMLNWKSIDENPGAVRPGVVELSPVTDAAFDRSWLLSLVREAVEPTNRKTDRNLSDLFSDVLRQTAGAHQVRGEIAALLRVSEGVDPELVLARELLLGLQDREHDMLRRRVLLGGAVAGAFVVGFALAALLWGRRPPAEESKPVRPEARPDERPAHQAELDVERASAFVYHGRDSVPRDLQLQEAVRALRRLRPRSPAIARALCLRVGAGVDPALFAEAAQAASGTEDGAALAWDHSVYRSIRESVWGEPAGVLAPPAGAPERVEADKALLGGEDRKAFELYVPLQQGRRGDPVAWLGGAAAAYRAGMFREALAAAEQAARLLDLPHGTPPEGAACAQALSGFCLEKLGQAEGALRRYERAATLSPGNPFVRGLLLRTPEQPPPKPATPGLLVFAAPKEAGRADLDKSMELVKARLQRAGLPVVAGPVWKESERKLELRLPGDDSTAAQRAEWLVTRRGVFAARPLAPRDLNDRWIPPECPEGHEWAPLNLSYPSYPPARWRLVRSDALTRSPGDFKIAASGGRITWTCTEGGRLSPGMGLALLLDGEIFWYGPVPESRSGSLTVGAESPQALIPAIFAEGPLPIQFVRE